ncbi:MAG: metal-dependent hydrolase [Sulfurospirillum sp.]|nr:metal-dependent hydrolase [Sulfurospirillum sp.]
MNILRADYILTCDKNFNILKNYAICFDKYILSVDKLENLVKQYPKAKVVKLPKNSVIMPGLINSHVHLEFSANKTTLKYGNFITWLNSVMLKREELLLQCSDEIVEKQLKTMQKSGTTTFGAISSFGNDFRVCHKTSQRVVFFIELLGSRIDSLELLLKNFKSRLQACKDNANEKLIPAISIHSPYATHPMLVSNALDIARKYSYVVSTHFMESKAEREWLDSGLGEFNDFFNNFTSNPQPMISASEYIKLFSEVKTLFTHCVQANKSELKMIKKIDGSITHCPISNRLLGVGKLNLSKVKNFTLGTDGLSSNVSLNLWDEMRAVLLSHEKIEINTLAEMTIKAVTTHGASALNINAGEIRVGKFADLNICELPDEVKSLKEIALQLILHTKFTKTTYIAGEKV